MRSLVVLAVVISILVSAVNHLVQAQGMRQPPPAMTTPPFPLDDPQAVAEGARRFSASCTGYCHGREGRVARAPKLRGKTYEPGFLFTRISNGYPAGQTGLPMPAFQTTLPPEEIWKVVAYIMSLSTAKDE
jgi:cytochrome c oxidase cbb3-type subunit 3